MLPNTLLFLVLSISLASGQDLPPQHSADAQKLPTIYIHESPDAKAMKDEIAAKLKESELVQMVNLEDQADFVLELVQSGKLNVMSGSGNKGAAVLTLKRTGEEVWSDSRGGGWSIRGFNNRVIGRKLGDELVKFFRAKASLATNSKD